MGRSGNIFPSTAARLLIYAFPSHSSIIFRSKISSAHFILIPFVFLVVLSDELKDRYADLVLLLQPTHGLCGPFQCFCITAGYIVADAGCNVTEPNPHVCDARRILTGFSFILVMTQLIWAEQVSKWKAKGTSLFPFLVVIVVLIHKLSPSICNHFKRSLSSVSSLDHLSNT
jgi:hypothetical protein